MWRRRRHRLIKQTQKRRTRLHAEGLAEFVTLPQAGRAKAWHLTAAGSAVAATFPGARRSDAQAPAAEQLAVRHARSKAHDLGGVARPDVTGPVGLVRARHDRWPALIFRDGP
ncbi:hypothetical protein F7Q99_31470 [Streptomyces kaniharaensis]|uniref:Uncharacterized protein n=1 Tax=Streptomyces kaniharaensis TaxID=212423 RepID=A0A6N7L1L4_9ACTN|nr:hypothetical protein [Streptomyces kaniharaensis]MQS16587.1 hypothetical protein [Streptomyces kaniharaensis]